MWCWHLTEVGKCGAIAMHDGMVANVVTMVVMVPGCHCDVTMYCIRMPSWIWSFLSYLSQLNFLISAEADTISGGGGLRR